jgi:hypothetical protein
MAVPPVGSSARDYHAQTSPSTPNALAQQSAAPSQAPVAQPATGKTPAAATAETVLAPLLTRANTPPRTGSGNEGRLYSSPEMLQGARTLISELHKQPDANERLNVLREVANQNYGFFTGLLSKASEVGTQRDRALIAEALGSGLQKGAFPLKSMANRGGQLSLDPIGWLMHQGPYTGPNVSYADGVHFTQREQLQALGNIIDLMNSQPQAAFNYRSMLARESIDAAIPGFDFTGQQLASIATEWAAGHTGADFARDGRLSLMGKGYTGLFDSIAKDFYRHGNTVATREAGRLLAHAAQHPAARELVGREVSWLRRELHSPNPGISSAYTRAVAAHADAVFDQLTDPKAHINKSADSTLRSLFEISYHNPEVDDSSRDALRTGMELFVKERKRDLLLSLMSSDRVSLSDSPHAARLELFTAALVNSYKDRYDQLRGDYEAVKRFASKVLFFPADFFPVGSTLVSWEWGRRNLLQEWSERSGNQFIRSDLVKNWLNAGNASTFTQWAADSLSGSAVAAVGGPTPPTFEPRQVLDLASDVILNLDLEVERLRRDPAEFNRLYELPATHPRSGKRLEAVTPEKAAQLFNWVDALRGASDDELAFGSMYRELKQLLTF